MKYKILLTIAIFFIGMNTINASYTTDSAFNYYDIPEDFSIVRSILQTSSITKDDVNKYKLLKLGMFQNIAALGAGAYATVKGGQATNFLLSQLGKLGPSENNKAWWALAGALGAGYGAYQILYTRVERGILNQIKTYIEMCQKLIVAKERLSNESIKSLGTQAYNSAWRASHIAREKGVNLLIEQGGNALALLDELLKNENNFETKNLITKMRNRISTFLPILESNRVIFEKLAIQELEKRKQQMGTNIRGARDRAQLQALQHQAGLLQASKWAVWSNFFKQSSENLVYAYDNREKILKALILGPAAVYVGLSYLYSKLTGK